MILCSWQFSVVPALRADAQDKLARLGKEVDRQLSSINTNDARTIRRELQNLIAAHTAHINRISIFTQSYHVAWRRVRPDVAREFDAIVEKRFETTDADIQRVVAYARNRAAEIILALMAKQYILIWLVALIAIPCFLIRRGMRVSSGLLDSALSRVASTIMTRRPNGSGRILSQHVLEESFLRTARRA